MIRKFKCFIVVLFLLGVGTAYAQTDKNKEQQRYFDINKNIEIFSSALREIDMFYVDSLDLNKTVRTGLNSMLNTLDPYTEYFNEEEMKEFNSQITGEYAGVGAVISYKNGKVTIVEPYGNSPAAKAGLKVGDAILAIDGKDMTKCEKVEGEDYPITLNSYVSSNLKGQPGTTIEVTVERPGEKKPVTVKVTREKISVDVIPFYGMVTPNIGYINFTTFTDKIASEFKNAFLDLKKQGATSLIIDLRGNGGGVLEEAVLIVNLFVPKGKVVVSTKSKLKQLDRTYRTTLEPNDTEIPIVVLTGSGSASASEIVAGSLQDMDRAVLVGERTFGKGLVQTSREMPFGGGLKVTTSKYYIPSGRCVQAIDYSHRSADGSVGRTPDSLTTVFYTELGRPVRDGGGITPDITLKEEKIPTITFYLSNQFIVFDWVTNWVQKNKAIAGPDSFTISDADYADFKEFVKSKDFKYDRISEKTIASLKEVMEFEGYMNAASDEFKALESKLVPDLDRDLETFKEPIMQLINAEIIKRYYFQKGAIQYELKHDAELKKAVEILDDKKLYEDILSAPKVDSNTADK